MSRYDLIALVGALALTVGIGMISVPIAVMVTGVALIGIGLMGSYLAARTGSKS